MKKLFLAIITITLFGSTLMAQDLSKFFQKSNQFFSENVTNGSVNYDGIAANPALLNELMDMAAKSSVSTNDANTFQAFYINAYNLTTIKGIIDNYPISSPLKVNGFFDKIKYEIAGSKVTLNDIENEILRKKFKDPRFHFVLVCGAVSCPPIINMAYMPETLNAQLDKQTKLALNGDYFIKVNSKKNKVEGSEIMKWYKEDFVMNGTEIDFINKYRTEKIPSDSKLSYYPYNWELNKL